MLGARPKGGRGGQQRPRGGQRRPEAGPVVPVSLALVEHLHLPEDPAADVAQALLDDLKCGEGVGGAQRGTPRTGQRVQGDPQDGGWGLWSQANGGWGCPKGLRQQNRPFPQRCQVAPSHGAAAKGPAPPPALVRAERARIPATGQAEIPTPCTLRAASVSPVHNYMGQPSSCCISTLTLKN